MDVMESDLGIMETYGLQGTVNCAISCSLTYRVVLG
jgi:hypothetical protein